MKDNKRSAVETLVDGSGASIPNRILGTFAMRSTPPAANRRAKSVRASRAPRSPAHRPAAAHHNPAAASVPAPSERVRQPSQAAGQRGGSAALAKAPVVAEREEEEPTTRVVRAMPPLKPVPASPTVDDVG